MSECCKKEHSHDHDHDHENCHCHNSSSQLGEVVSCGCGCDHDHGGDGKVFSWLDIIGLILVVAGILPFLGELRPILITLGTVAIGFPLFKAGIGALLKLQGFDELGLLTVAVVASFALAYTSADPFEGVLEAMAVTVFFRIGSILEERAIAKSQRDIEALANMRPDTAFVMENGIAREVVAEKVAIGSIIQLTAGARVPIDCKIVEGSGYIDLSAITGEPIPAQGYIGYEIPSGAVNVDGLLLCQTTSSFEESTASRIISFVRDSAQRKGKAEKFISRFAKIYTPAVVAAAAALAFLPPLLGAGSFSLWISRALVFLVASCPCALVISVPLTFFAGVGAASRSGVLVKGSCYLEELAKVDCIAFDKTGTITRGVPVVSQFKLVEGFEKEELLAIAATAEQHSTHPVAKAVVKYAAQAQTYNVENYREVAGMGVSLTCNSKEIICGSKRLMEQNSINTQSLGDANVYIAVNGVLACSFVLEDTPRPEAAEVIKQLALAGCKTTAMLTGDAFDAAEKIAKEVGITIFKAALLPEQKSQELELLKQNSKGVAFVGDGINDAPVLATANVGIAMGLGSDAAIEAADVVLVDHSLKALPNAIKIAKRTVNKAKQNIVFALGVKLIVLTLGALGYANMWAAVFADVGVSIIAIFNALTLLRDIKK